MFKLKLDRNSVWNVSGNSSNNAKLKSVGLYLLDILTDEERTNLVQDQTSIMSVTIAERVQTRAMTELAKAEVTPTPGAVQRTKATTVGAVYNRLNEINKKKEADAALAVPPPGLHSFWGTSPNT
jgi:hypothetical protein